MTTHQPVAAFSNDCFGCEADPPFLPPPPSGLPAFPLMLAIRLCFRDLCYVFGVAAIFAAALAVLGGLTFLLVHRPLLGIAAVTFFSGVATVINRVYRMYRRLD